MYNIGGGFLLEKKFEMIIIEEFSNFDYVNLKGGISVKIFF